MSNAVVVWEMSYDQGEEYFELLRQVENYEIDDDEFAERLMTMPGYPLPGLPNPDAWVTLHIRIRPKIQVSVPRERLN
jgi:hypothetical protein